jgi:predicted amidohydrolase YtcJ
LGFYASITRQDAEGHPAGGWYPDQRLNREETLRAFTQTTAFASLQEDQLGSISIGKHADFVILSDDIMTIPPMDILKTRVLSTYVGGKLVYQAA